MGESDCPVIGLAGGIGSGKSTISGIFKRMGAVIINADEIAHHVLELPETLARVEREFTDAVIENGRVSRAALSDVVFNDCKKLERLNAIIHPVVMCSTRRFSSKRGSRVFAMRWFLWRPMKK